MGVREVVRKLLGCVRSVVTIREIYNKIVYVLKGIMIKIRVRSVIVVRISLESFVRNVIRIHV